MAYCTLADMKKLIPETMLISLSNDTAGAGSVKSTVINEAIDQADREIDSYIGLITAVPLTTVPGLIANLSAKMAIWNLHLRKYFDSAVWRETYNHCIALLLKISQGKLTIDADIDTAYSSMDAVSRTQRFTSEFWEYY